MARRDVVFGEVWFCSGQSNAWLPMSFSLSRNRTYDAIRRGRFRNIRMYTVDQESQLDTDVSRVNFSFDRFIGAYPNAYDGTTWDYPSGGWLLPTVGTYPDGPVQD
eukprot:m.440439 g.440439  ORF g.440439 m.440439 type:complete len:106 (+) comp18521_c0_seq1:575-892(+)